MFACMGSQLSRFKSYSLMIVVVIRPPLADNPPIGVFTPNCDSHKATSNTWSCVFINIDSVHCFWFPLSTGYTKRNLSRRGKVKWRRAKNGQLVSIISDTIFCGCHSKVGTVTFCYPMPWCPCRCMKQRSHFPLWLVSLMTISCKTA